MGFVLTCVYIVLIIVRPQMWIAGGVLVKYHIVDPFVALAVFITFAELLARQVRWPGRSLVGNLLLAFLGAVALSHLANGFLSAALHAFTDFSKVLILVFLVLINVNSVRRMQILMRLLGVSTLFIMAHCWLQWYTGSGFAGLPPVYSHEVVDDIIVSEVRVRYFGIFQDPNDTALVLVTLLPFSLCAVRAAVKVRYWAWFGVTWVLTAMTVSFTNSRSGFLALIVASLCLVRLRLGHIRLPAAVVGLAAITLVFLGPSRFSRGVTDNSSYKRTQYWADVNQAFKHHPLFGVGYGHINRYVEDERSPHSAYVKCYGELGLLGYTLWIGAIATAMLGSWRLSRVIAEDDEDRYLARLGYCAIAAVTAFCASAFFLGRPYDTTLYLVLAIAAAGVQMADRRVAPEELLDWWRRRLLWVAPLGSVTTILVIWWTVRLMNAMR